MANSEPILGKYTQWTDDDVTVQTFEYFPPDDLEDAFIFNKTDTSNDIAKPEDPNVVTETTLKQCANKKSFMQKFLPMFKKESYSVKEKKKKCTKSYEIAPIPISPKEKGSSKENNIIKTIANEFK